MIVLPLAERPEAIAAVARLLHREWCHLAAWSDLARIEHELRARARTDGVPFSAVAWAGNVVAGSASLKLHELPWHEDKMYWLGDVIVASSHRGRGIGTALINACVDKSRELQATPLHLYTPDQVRHYAKMGWVAVAEDEAHGEHVVIMRRDL